MNNKISFASENYAGVCVEVIDFYNKINQGQVSGYGEDIYTQKAIDLFKREFGEHIEIFFVYNGTAANTLALGTMTCSYNSIICSDISHIIVHEVTAPHSWTGCKFINLPHINGKINVEQIKTAFENEIFWGRHTAIPKVVSITQPTEYGTLYNLDEIKTISSYCHSNGMLLHMDGARISNACVALNCSFKEVTLDCGVDVLSFGATKNGLMFGEAIVFFNNQLSQNFEYLQKQGLQLHSKMRFISGPFIPYLEKKIWEKNALHANQMCKLLSEKIEKVIKGCLIYPVQTNQIFAKIPLKMVQELHKDFHFYIFNPQEEIVRLVTSFDTKQSDIEAFGIKLKEVYK